MRAPIYNCGMPSVNGVGNLWDGITAGSIGDTAQNFLGNVFAPSDEDSDWWDRITDAAGEVVWDIFTPDPTSQQQATNNGPIVTTTAPTAGGGIGTGVLLLGVAALFLLSKR